MMRFVVIDNCPVPEKAAPFVAEAKRRSGQTLNSCFRGQEARDLLAKFGKHDQAYLYWGYIHHLPGFNPANPPGFSPHECRCDGVFPPGYRRGSVIPDELVGTDWTSGVAVLRAYREMGIPAVMPYNSPLEAQHVDIAQIPKKTFVLKQGDKGKKVVQLKHMLYVAERPHGAGRYYTTDRESYFGRILTRVVKQFQHDHGLEPDGVVGPLTFAQIHYSYEYWKKRHDDKGKPKKPSPHTHTSHGHSRKAYKGLDVSNNNGDIDWSHVRDDGYLLSYLRATEGLSGAGSEDEFFTKARLDAMRHAGVVPGYYHYGHPQPGRSAEEEVHHFVNYVDAADGWNQPVILPPCLDAEWNGGLGQKDLAKWYSDFLGHLEHHLRALIDKDRAAEIQAVTSYDPRIPALYTGNWFWLPQTGDAKGFGRYPLYISNYTSTPTIPALPRSWKGKPVFALQHSETGAVSGVHGHTDLDIFYGYIDQKRLAALL
jgi:lysozyme